MTEKLSLYGFNNLTKTLSFNIYDICYAKSFREQRDYLDYINEQYNSDRLTSILVKVCEMIGATILNISKQDYDPQGASVNILFAEEPVNKERQDKSNNWGYYSDGSGPISPELEKVKTKGPKLPPPPLQREDLALASEDSTESKATEAEGETIHAHLDKSHITVHTFPESHPNRAISTFRVDIDVATCGTVSPIICLDYLIDSFESDIMTIDYRVRGFTRDTNGQKHFLDHPIRSIQDFISEEQLRRYDATDINVYQANLFHTRLMIKEIVLQNYLFNTDVYEIPPAHRLKIHEALQREMIDIYSGSNIFDL
ncbi:MAG: S-adenosylmethionine decarboxylase [Eubacteriales bacterium]|nr:S-adenosylmethionine decarboxylase [Eubacteriales bacterium]